MVITSALHAEGPGFEPQRNHNVLSFLLLKDNDETYFMDLLFNKQSIKSCDVIKTDSDIVQPELIIVLPQTKVVYVI